MPIFWHFFWPERNQAKSTFKPKSNANQSSQSGFCFRTPCYWKWPLAGLSPLGGGGVAQTGKKKTFLRCRGLNGTFNPPTPAVLMNHIPLLKVLFSDKYLLLLMGIFEYDPELPARPQHRKYLQHVVVFKEVGARHPCLSL